MAGLRSAAGDIPLDLYVVPVAGGTAVNQVDGGAGGSWSPDGMRIAYTAGEYSSEVYVVEVATGATSQVTKNTYNEGVPAWSPDGTQLAFAGQATETATPQIYVMRTDGSGLRPVTTSAGEKGAPAWSPAGTELAFTNLAPRGIFVVAAGGGAERRITPGGSKLFYYDLSWQPVGGAAANAGTGPAAAGADGSTPRLPCTIDGAKAGHRRIVLLPGTKKEIRYWQIDGTDRNDVKRHLPQRSDPPRQGQ